MRTPTEPDLALSWLILTVVVCATIYCLVFASYLVTL